MALLEECLPHHGARHSCRWRVYDSIRRLFANLAAEPGRNSAQTDCAFRVLSKRREFERAGRPRTDRRRTPRRRLSKLIFDTCLSKVAEPRTARRLSCGSGAEVVRHRIELGSVPMDLLLSTVRALLAAVTPEGPRTGSRSSKKPTKSQCRKSRHFIF
jgi:hypothetical protein